MAEVGGATNGPEARTAMERLRDCTRELHAVAERSSLARAVIDATLPRHEYARLLRLMRIVHARLEAALATSRDARVRVIGDTIPSKLPWLDHDLALLAEVAPEPTGDAATAAARASAVAIAIDALCRRLATAAAGGVALLGALYVLEGSTNGGPFLALRLAQNPQIPRAATTYYRGYGAQTVARWRAFGELVNRALPAPLEQDLVIDVARGMFVDVERCFDALGAALEGPRRADAADTSRTTT